MSPRGTYLGSLAGSLTALIVGLAVQRPATAAAQSVAVVVAGVDTHSAQGRALVKELRAAVHTHKALHLLEQDRADFLFASVPAEDRTEARAAAGRLLHQAQEHLQSFQVDEAKDALAEATQLLKPDLGLEAARPLNQLRLALAVAVGHAQRDAKTLASALDQYAARFGTTPPDRGLWPPELERRLVTVVARVQTKLQIISKPAGEAFVDGRAVGPTPVTVDDLPPGRHRVEVRAPDHLPGFEWANTTSTRLARVPVELAPALQHRLEGLPAEGPIPDDLLALLAETAERGPAELLAIATPAGQGGVSVRIIEAGPKPALHGPMVGDSAAAAFDLAWATWAKAQTTAPGRALQPWAFGAAGLGVAAASVGVAMRLWAKDTQEPLQSRRGALTQTDAYAIQDRAQSRALIGTLLIGAGAALFAGGAGLFTWDLISTESP